MTRPHPALHRIFANQTAWLTTLAANERAIWHENGITACFTPDHAHLMLPADAMIQPETIDAAFTWLRESGISPLLIWTDYDNLALDTMLTARGAGPSWNPRWMQRDLTQSLEDWPAPTGIRIERATVAHLPVLESARDVPYLSVGESRIVLDPSHAGSMQMFVACEESSGEIVGIIVAFTPQNGSQQAGIYNAGVRPDWQHRGIGSALTATACRAARDTGALAISLNATPAGERTYRKVGFEVLGDGRTWFMRLA